MIPLVRLVFPVLETTPQLASEFERLRAESLSLLSKVGEADLNRTARHQELGIVAPRGDDPRVGGARPDAHGPG